MTYQPHPNIRLKSYIPQPQLFSPLVWFTTATTLFSSSHQLGYNLFNQSALALFGRKKSYVSQWAVADWAKMLEHKLRRLLADQRLFRSVVVEQEEWTQALPKNHREEPWVSGERMASWARQSLTLETSTSTSTCDKVEDLDVY